MKRLVLVCLATAWLISAGPGLTGDALGAPPEYGTIEGNIWTNQFSMNGEDDAAYSFCPVPDTIVLGESQVYSLKSGNIMVWKGAGLEIYSIIEFDESAMAEHAIAAPPMYKSPVDGAFSFGSPGLYSVHLLDADSPIMMLTVQVKDE